MLYPNDSSPAGKQLRLEQQYFFVSCALQDCIRLLLQRAHDPRVRRQVRDPAQRHAPGARGPRADAPAHRRARPRLGRGVGSGAALDRVHEPHAAARGARDLAAAAVRSACCRATSRSSTRSTGASSTRSARGSRATTRALRRMSLIGEDGDKHGAHGAPRDGREPPRQRRRGAALAAAARDRAARLRRAVARAVHQRDQRRHAAPVRRAREPAARRADHRGDRRRLAARPRSAARARAARRRRRVPGRLARGQAREQGRARDWLRARARPRRRSGVDVRRAVQAHPRVQAPAPEPAARDRAVGPHPPRRRRRRAAHDRVRRQGRARRTARRS